MYPNMVKSSYRLSLFHLHHKIEKKKNLVTTTLTIMSYGIKINRTSKHMLKCTKFEPKK